VEESEINPLHGSNSRSAARREIQKIFPVETTVAVIKPETAEENGGKDIVFFSISCYPHRRIKKLNILQLFIVGS
jgi:hypothetical protein